jgi:hypothetical protein
VALSASSGAGAPNPTGALADHTSTAIAGGSVLLAIALLVALVLIVPSEITTRRASRRAAASPDDGVEAVGDRELDGIVGSVGSVVVSHAAQGTPRPVPSD